MLNNATGFRKIYLATGYTVLTLERLRRIIALDYLSILLTLNSKFFCSRNAKIRL